jgi:hypothetical protein
MISSVDPANSGAALFTQSSTSTLPQATTAANQTTTGNFLPTSIQSSPSSLTDTLNGLLTMLQNLMASIGSLFGGNNGGNGINAGTVTPGANRAGQFDFLRQVDQEPATVIQAPAKKPGPDSLNDAVPDGTEDKTVIGDTTPADKTETKKTPKRTALKKSNGEFLWKPKSDKDGKLAILLPKGLTGKVKGVKILSPDGSQVLGKGKNSGVGNGDREHFRFSKAGGQFPDGAMVVITLKDGSERTVTIKETNDRTTR